MNYEEVGLKVGLEVHQQLLTRKKLFCRCPAGRYTREHDGVVLRHMRPTLSELGVYDGTALMEFKTRKKIVYLLNKANVCTYEMDDTPPFLVNQNAIDVAIEQCLMLGCDIVDEVHIARKQYLDGSIPTGFQRTAIVGVEGRLPFKGREISITQVSVEEDSCREVSDRGHLVVWRADRLGMPLIETVTGPDLRTPEEVAEAILLLGRVCRSTGHVRTGIGASRQDVNVSVRGGTRVEIKGVPKAGWAPGLVHGEALRQVNLLKLKEELHRRGISSPDHVRTDSQDVTALLADADIPFLQGGEWMKWVKAEGRRPDFELGQGVFCVKALRLVGLGGLFAWPTQPDRNFASELAGRVRVVAGLDQPPIILHDQCWPDNHGALQALAAIRKRMNCTENDALVLVWGPSDDTNTAAKEIQLRIAEATQGVPAETRQPFVDGSTDFERILPGPDRMYPDTDSPPTRVFRDRVRSLEQGLPEPAWVREKRYGEVGVPRDTVYYLLRRGGANLVDRVVKRNGTDLRRACFFFGESLKGLSRAGAIKQPVSSERWSEFFELVGHRPLLWEARSQIVRAMAKEPQKPLGEILESGGWGSAPDDWEERVKQGLTRAQEQCRKPAEPARLARLALGISLAQLRGKVPVVQVKGLIATLLEEENERS